MIRRRPSARVASIVFAAALVVLAVAGCSAKSASGFTRTLAQKDTASWTAQALQAVAHPTPEFQVKTDGYLNCRTDTSYFPTTFEWRTITNVSVPLARQAQATAAIRESFDASGWKGTKAGGILTLTGPSGDSRRGVITVQTAGSSALAVSVISPCYK